MEKNWFTKKFLNPRSAEGKPQTERLEYAKEFFQNFGDQNKRFSGAAILGSTMKGYGLEESSDIDVALFYYYDEKSEYGSDNFREDFKKFKRDFSLKKIKKKEKTFNIDTDPGRHNLADFFEVYSDGTITISAEKLRSFAVMLWELSHPIIGTERPDAVMPMKKVLDAIREAISKLNTEQKTQLIQNKILPFANYFIKTELKNYSERVNANVDMVDYMESRRKMFQKQLENKFGLI